MMATGTQEIPQSVQEDPDDVLLVKRFQRGEESAFNHLVIRYPTTIYQLAQRYTTKHEDTLDITQGSLKPIEDCPVSTDSASFIHGPTVLPAISVSIIYASKSGTETGELTPRNPPMTCWPRL